MKIQIKKLDSSVNAYIRKNKIVLTIKILKVNIQESS